MQLCADMCVRQFLRLILNRTHMKISLYRVVVGVELDGDVRFCVLLRISIKALPKSIFWFVFSDFLGICHDLFVLCIFFDCGFFFPCHRRQAENATAAVMAAAATAAAAAAAAAASGFC